MKYTVCVPSIYGTLWTSDGQVLSETRAGTTKPLRLMQAVAVVERLRPVGLKNDINFGRARIVPFRRRP